MLDVMAQRIQDDMSYHTKLNIIREFLQIVCLKIMSDTHMFENVAFLGGTALRIVYNVKRFSEDMDFSLIDGKTFSCEDCEENFAKKFPLYGIKIETKQQKVGAVHSILFKFPSLLNELHLSDHKHEKLMIKWDIDTNPPRGARMTHSMLNNVYMFAIGHYDLPSLFAGKLHACFFRKYIKGRDWYDFVWYMTKKVSPNYTMLNNAIRQTHDSHELLTEETIKVFMRERVANIDFKAVRRDVEPFLEDAHEGEMLKREYLEKIIGEMNVV